jgi:predicted dehydrogenase
MFPKSYASIVSTLQKNIMKKLRWGILSTAKIGREKVIPAIQKGGLCEVIAIASRQKELAEKEAVRLNISKSYDSYEALLSDPEIDAIYIPLPNDMHVHWSIEAMKSGKHVLCEKPIGLSSAEAKQLIDAAAQYPALKIMEAFMYRFHPQWQKAKDLVKEGSIGELKTVHSFFSYYNVDPNNIRNQKEKGGGGLMDIGCYNISLSRFLFEEEPKKVCGLVEYDPQMQTDRIASGILQFSKGSSTFTCSTQLTPYQRVHIFGTEGRIEIEIPFNAPPDKQTKLWLHTKDGSEEMIFDEVDQYTLQADAFARAVLEDTAVPYPLEDALNNMKVIEAVYESSKAGSIKGLPS